MITPSFSLTATERVLPKLALDFTTATLDSRVTFTRSGNTATVTNSSGFVTTINANLPRFDYNPVTLVCKGLLIEEARTNQALSSDAFDAANWLKTRCSVTAGAAVAPNNATDADKFVEDTSSGTHALQTSTLLTIVSTAYSGSVYAKAGERSWIVVGIGTTVSGIAYFDLSNGTVGTVTAGFTASITAAGNGWYRCSVSGTISVTNQSAMAIYLATGNNAASYTGNGTSGVYVWGAQFEAGAFATSYIPTITSQVTRTADVATMTGTNFSDWFNASEGAFAVTAICKSTPTAGKFPYTLHCLSTAGNDINLYQNGATSQQAFIRVSNTGQATLNSTVVAANTLYTQVAAYKQNSFAGCVNAGTVQTDISGNVPTLTTMHIGAANTTGFELNGWVQKLNYWPQRIINAEVQAFSK